MTPPPHTPPVATPLAKTSVNLAWLKQLTFGIFPCFFASTFLLLWSRKKGRQVFERNEKKTCVTTSNQTRLKIQPLSTYMFKSYILIFYTKNPLPVILFNCRGSVPDGHLFQKSLTYRAWVTLSKGSYSGSYTSRGSFIPRVTLF